MERIVIFSWGLLSLLFFAFWVWMMVECVGNEQDKNERVMWALFMCIMAALFVPVYYFSRYRPRKREQRDKRRIERASASPPNGGRN
jgi:hypothetical protein